jgi:hypothetical protein
MKIVVGVDTPGLSAIILTQYSQQVVLKATLRPQGESLRSKIASQFESVDELMKRIDTRQFACTLLVVHYQALLPTIDQFVLQGNSDLNISCASTISRVEKEH